jgi:hypothetical protein
MKMNSQLNSRFWLLASGHWQNSRKKKLRAMSFELRASRKQPKKKLLFAGLPFMSETAN